MNAFFLRMPDTEAELPIWGACKSGDPVALANILENHKPNVNGKAMLQTLKVI